jgi:hypothetical protein
MPAMSRTVRAFRLVAGWAVGAFAAGCVAVITARAFGQAAGVFALILVPIGLMFLLDMPKLRRSRRWGRGECLHCGYELTGNVSGVCPECGEAT